MASLNVFEPIFFFGIIIFLTHKLMSKTNLLVRYFNVRFFSLNSVLSTNKGEGGGEGGREVKTPLGILI